jgi:hypothetical protein
VGCSLHPAPYRNGNNQATSRTLTTSTTIENGTTTLTKSPRVSARMAPAQLQAIESAARTEDGRELYPRLVEQYGYRAPATERFSGAEADRWATAGTFRRGPGGNQGGACGAGAVAPARGDS